MANQPFLATYEVTLAANKAYTIPGGGDKLAMLEASAPINIEFLNVRGGNNFKAEGVEVGMSDIGPGDIFHTIKITSAVIQTVKIAVYAGLLTVSKLAGAVTVNAATTANCVAVVVNAAAVELIALRTGRKSATIYNNGANTIYIGGAGVTVASGLPVAAGASYTVDNSGAAIYGIAAAATAENIRVLENY